MIIQNSTKRSKLMRLPCYYFFNWQRTNQINRIFMHLNVHHFPNSNSSLSIFYKVSKSQLHLNAPPSPPCFLEPQRMQQVVSREVRQWVCGTYTCEQFCHPSRKNIFFLSLLSLNRMRSALPAQPGFSALISNPPLSRLYLFHQKGSKTIVDCFY